MMKHKTIRELYHVSMDGEIETMDNGKEYGTTELDAKTKAELFNTLYTGSNGTIVPTRKEGMFIYSKLSRTALSTVRIVESMVCESHKIVSYTVVYRAGDNYLVKTSSMII